MQIPTFEGIMTVVTTPFDKNGAIAYDALGKHLDFLIANGVHYIIPGGTTGEYYAQTIDERREVLAYVAGRVGKRVRLAAGTNSVRPADTIELSNYAKDLGYEALMMGPVEFDAKGELKQPSLYLYKVDGNGFVLEWPKSS